MSVSADAALVIIDMQNDFVRKNGTAPVAGAESTIPAIAEAASLCRKRNIPVIHVIRRHKEDGSDAEIFRRAQFLQGRGICVEGSWGAQIVQELTPEPMDAVICKTRFSGFHRTDLLEYLQQRGIKTILLAGTQYPNCVRGTAVDALAWDFNVVLLPECCSAQSEDVAAANLQDMRNMGMKAMLLSEF